MNNVQKWFVRIIISILISSIAGWLIICYRFLTQPLIQTQPFYYQIQPGASLRTLISDLQQRGILSHPDFFFILAHLSGAASQLKAGEYFFSVGTTPYDFLNKIRMGKILLRHFTIVEGWTFRQMLHALAIAPYVRTTLQRPDALFKALDLPPCNLEGLFFPATYYFPANTADTQLLKRAYRLMQRKLQAAWRQRASGLPYTEAYQALIVASLIEKETALAQERANVAGVIINRLKKNMPLQFDSIVIYGLGDNFTGHLTKAQLQQDGSYNSYTRKGLPPTPIAIPSLASLQAALHPQLNDHLYFVTGGNGRLQFSDNLAQHKEAVVLYRDQIHYFMPATLMPRSCPKSSWLLSKQLTGILCFAYE